MSLLDTAYSSSSFKWDDRLARHLLNRGGFGVPPAAIAKLAAMRPETAINAFINYEKFPDNLPAPSWIPASMDFQEMRKMAATFTEEEKQVLRRERQREETDTMSRLQVWWLDRICHTQRPLEEKLTLFWHGHFATSAEKVKDPAANYKLNQIFRHNASGNFRRLVTEVGKSAAMMRYLDQQQSNRQHPNENWARELMELFTLGIGHYTEQDIKEGARAFTGWSDRSGQFSFDMRRHDSGEKTFLGRTGNFDGDQIIGIILDQPACAEFICRKLWKFFAYDDPEPEIVSQLAQTLRSNNYELKPVLSQMFSSSAFYSDKAVASQVKCPAQLVANLLIQLDAPLSEKPPIAQLAMRAMGQSLFFPPNVKGWDGGRAWINTNTMLVRYNFSNFLVSGVVPEFGGGGGKGQILRQLKDFGDRKRRAAKEGGQPQDGSMMNGEERMVTSSESSAAEGMNPREMPAGQDSMPKDIPSQTLYAALRQRRSGMDSHSGDMQRAPFRVRDFFARYEGMTAEEIVDELASYFIGFPLEETQRSKLISTLAQGVEKGQPVPVLKMAEEDLRGTVQLLLSTAEYQVC